MIRKSRTKPEMSDEQFLEICQEFRDGMLDRMSPKGKCAMISWALQGFLGAILGVKTTVYESRVGRWNHLWLMLEDGRVLDCTADQFNTKRQTYPPAYLGKPLAIHKNGKPYKVSTD